MAVIDPWKLFMWTFRRNEKDVINLYDSLSDIMRLSTGGDMLNFGYWQDTVQDPQSAQLNLCSLFLKRAQLQSGQMIADVGSGFSAPAFYWAQSIDDLRIVCVNTNYGQLSYSVRKDQKQDSISFVNSSATKLPFGDSSLDRVLALESCQHFKPIESFFLESHRVLKKDGMLVLALPVLSKSFTVPAYAMGLVAFTWSSEHYTFSEILGKLSQSGFEIIDSKKIGKAVYQPLADYYFKNRNHIKQNLSEKYPDYVESILARSISKMNSLSKDNVIDYVLLLCRPFGKNK